ncbi:hypothetical protein RMATCC62417_15017 [Rhizopus microsporus]|nr:hypothetical protein RMATCC62417_15017 [Rhizopus microsporus]
MNKENRRIYSHHRSSQGQGKLEPLKVKLPVQKQIISTEEQPQQRKALQPAVTNTDRASIRVQHRPDPTKSKKRVASELVDERSVPSIIHDVKRNLKYQKHEYLRLTVTQALKHPFFLSHNIPENLPRDALFKQPSHKSLYPSEYNNTSSQSKVADSIRHAANENESYVDQSIQPPLELLEEVVLDHRTHFPIKQALSHTSRMVIPKPNIPSASLKRKYSNMDKDVSSSAAKRINTLNNNTNGTNSVAVIARQDMPIHDATKHMDATKDSSTKRANAPATTTKKITEPAIEQISNQTQTGRKPIIEEMAEKLKIMIERKEIRPVPNKNEIESYKEGKLEWNRGNVFIKSWLDGSKRYGFCYCLSDDTLGALYNDGSTLTTHDEKHYYYLYQRQHSTGYIESTYTHDQFPANLEKKRHILQQFKYYNVTNLDVDYGTPKASYPTGTHVLKYAVDKSAISFKLNNGVVQFNFFNHNKLILYDGGRKLVFIDENKSLSHHHTIDALYSDNQSLIECIKSGYQMLKAQNEIRLEVLRNERWKRYKRLNTVPLR